MLETIIDNPKHPLLELALNHYPQVSGNAPAAALVELVLRSPRYGEAIKRKARALQGRLQTNPYFAISVMPDEPDALGRKTMGITVINVSAERIVLRAQNPLDLLTVTVIDSSGRALPQLKRSLAKTASMKAGESIELEPRGVFDFPPLQWWDFVELGKVSADTRLQFTVQVQSPGLWPHPAQSDLLDIAPASVNAAREYQVAELKGRSDP